MRDQVAQSNGIPAMRLRQLGKPLRWQALQGFADHLGVEQHGVDRRFVGLPLRKAAAGDKSSDLFGGADEIVQMQSPVTRYR